MPFGDTMSIPRGKGMHHLRRLWLPLLAISFLTPAQGTEVGEGVIQGVVLGEGGRPVGGANVHAELKGIPMAKAIRYVETDEKGFFLIDQLEFGTYYVSVKNEEEEYGDSGFSFFNDQPVPIAQISAQHRIADVVVNLGPKAGILTGTISDAATGKPIPAGFDLAQVKDRTKCMGTSAAPNFRVLIPSSKEVEVKVSAPGYEAWVYPDPSIPSQVLRMDPSSEIHLDIQLKPVHDRGLPVSKFLMPEDAAERQYFYYAADGSERNLAADYRNGNGMIWQETPGSRGGKMRMFIFFVGTEEQSKTRPHTGFLAPVCP